MMDLMHMSGLNQTSDQLVDGSSLHRYGCAEGGGGSCLGKGVVEGQ